jgi:hypothetical protein
MTTAASVTVHRRLAANTGIPVFAVLPAHRALKDPRVWQALRDR